MVSFDNYSSAVGYTITVTWELLPRTCSDVAGVSDSETYYTYVRMMEYTITGLDANSLYSITVLISNPAGSVTSHPINATTQEKGIIIHKVFAYYLFRCPLLPEQQNHLLLLN